MRLGLILSIILLAACGAGTGTRATQPPAEVQAVREWTYEVVRSYPHDPDAFTEGLFWLDGYLYESTGLEGKSSIRKVELETGKVVLRRDLAEPYFGEGIINAGDRLVQLTWQHHKGFIYDLATFAPKGEFEYPGEGWAFTRDANRLIMDDGTNEIRFLDPATLKETGRIKVTFNGKPLDQLNELEWIKGEIWANIWLTDMIARIDPATGKVVGRIDLTGLLKPEDRGTGEPDVLNGIAYDAARDRIFVTGKNWPKLYEIRLVPKP